jgi:hypothetical protein
MNTEAQELADNLRGTAWELKESSKKAREFWNESCTPQTLVNIRKMESAARELEQWADSIDAEYCKGDEA